MRGPGVIPGSTFPQLATNVDLGPTIMSLAGIDAGEIAAASDGQSMLPLIISPTWRDEEEGGVASSSSLPASVRAYLVGLDKTAAAAGNITTPTDPPTASVEDADADAGRAAGGAAGGAGNALFACRVELTQAHPAP